MMNVTISYEESSEDNFIMIEESAKIMANIK